MNAQGNASNLIGKTLGQFEVIDEIGRGGMATVYRARQKSINRTVALKVLPPALLHDPTFYERFTREVDVIAHLEHPHIVPIYDFGEADGIPYIAMRYLAQGSMASFVRRGKLPQLQELERPIQQIAQGLNHAHLQGVIHRDLKPGNILLDDRNNAYLTDFGIARVLDSNLTGSAIIGTPAYMSPEQANGTQLDGRSDIYSLGIVLFEMITGREPFEAETPLALILKHINEPMPSLSDFRPGVSRLVEQVIAKATAKKPDDRYNSATEMATAFSEALRITSYDVEVDDQPTLAPNSSDTPLRNITPPRTPLSSRPTPYAKSTEEAFVPTMRDTPRELIHQSALADKEGKTEAIRAVPSTAEIPQNPSATAPKTSNRLPLMLGAIAILVVVIGVTALIANFDDPDAPLPTPFAQSANFNADQFTLNIPQSWVYSQKLDEYGVKQTWQDTNANLVVTVATLDEDTLTARSFVGSVNEYETRNYTPPNFTILDSYTDESDDGFMRRSYRIEGHETLSNGQIDVFYLRRNDEFYVIETYASDASGNTNIATLQSILDSLRFS